MSKRCLVVEDDPNIAELLRLYLTKDGFDVMIASDGNKAEADFDLFQPDVILLDIMLPGKDGWEVCRAIRKKSSTPIIMLTAKGETNDKVTGLEMGADDYITKPFSPGELLARVKAHMARYDRLTGIQSRGNEKVEIRGLTIDRTARRVWVGEEEVSLTGREFDLLSYLAMNPNRVFSKQELFKAIWGLESLGDVATVTVHIKKIREKIELNMARPQYIETVWGVGYRFKI